MSRKQKCVYERIRVDYERFYVDYQRIFVVYERVSVDYQRISLFYRRNDKKLHDYCFTVSLTLPVFPRGIECPLNIPFNFTKPISRKQKRAYERIRVDYELIFVVYERVSVDYQRISLFYRRNDKKLHDYRFPVSQIFI